MTAALATHLEQAVAAVRLARVALTAVNEGIDSLADTDAYRGDLCRLTELEEQLRRDLWLEQHQASDVPYSVGLIIEADLEL